MPRLKQVQKVNTSLRLLTSGLPMSTRTSVISKWNLQSPFQAALSALRIVLHRDMKFNSAIFSKLLLFGKFCYSTKLGRRDGACA